MLLAQYDFTTLVMAEVVFILALYIIMPLAVIKLRKTIPVEQRKGCFIIPGGKVGLYLFTGLPLSISIIALLINGTDYFLIGILATATGPLFYLVAKLRYGGLNKNNPILYPINQRTKLAEGDLFRISFYSIIAGAFSIIGHFFLFWYKGEWGKKYYLSEYEKGYFSDFQGMIDSLLTGGLIAITLGITLFYIGYKVEQKKT